MIERGDKMFEILCNLFFNSNYYRYWCESVLTELSEQYFIPVKKKDIRAKRYVLSKLKKLGIIGITGKWDKRYEINQTFIEKILSEIQTLNSIPNEWKTIRNIKYSIKFEEPKGRLGNVSD